MNIIEQVKNIINSYPKISEFSHDVHVDYTDDSAINYGLSSIGDALVSSDILGNQERRHSFVLYAVNQSFNDYDRLKNSSFLLDLTYWLEQIPSGEYELEMTENNVTRTGYIKRISCANAMLYTYQNGTVEGSVTYQLQLYADYRLNSEEE